MVFNNKDNYFLDEKEMYLTAQNYDIGLLEELEGAERA